MPRILFFLAAILLSGLIAGRAVKLVRLPNVTGYLIAGLLIGPHCLGLLPDDFVTDLNLVSEMALAFIAFTIGSEFRLSYLKRVGPTPIVIAALEAFVAVIAVTLGLVAFGFGLPLALLLGAIASATAPAATVMVVKEYRAKGPLTETLLSVVALDDAAALIAFGFATTLVRSMRGAGGGFSWMTLLRPFLEILASVLLGFLLGALFTVPLRFFRDASNRTIVMVAFVFLGSAVASFLNLSSLLLCMCMGAMLTNVSKAAPAVVKLADSITPPIFLIFFVVSGAEFNISILPGIGLVGVLYVLFRVLGKVLGAFLGSLIMKAPDAVRKYIGLTLLPQAGVAIGLSLVASQTMPGFGTTIRAVVLCATFIYELIGPMLTRIALSKAGEIRPKPPEDGPRNRPAV